MFGVAVSKICRWYNQIQKNNASTNTNFSFRSPVLANNFTLQVLWKRTRSVFINIFFLHFSLLTWLNSRSSRKPIKREACIHDISLFLCHKSWRTEKVIDRKYQSGPGRCWTRSEGHHGEKIKNASFASDPGGVEHGPRDQFCPITSSQTVDWFLHLCAGSLLNFLRFSPFNKWFTIIFFWKSLSRQM